ncbi:hypothetical protein BS78_07G117800 [Paspalum vaginatum]|nr:hypothetical protein BS78_07G117800 [Paspalum vaginatum]
MRRWPICMIQYICAMQVACVKCFNQYIKREKITYLFWLLLDWRRCRGLAAKSDADRPFTRSPARRCPLDAGGRATARG